MRGRRNVKKDIKYVKDKINGESFSVLIEETNDKKYGLKLRPWCKIYPKKGEINKIKSKMLKYGIDPIIQDNTLVIKNISPCLLARKFLEPPLWWIKSLNMMENGLHNTKKGIIAIMKKRNEKSKWKGKNRKWTIDKVIEKISENS